MLENQNPWISIWRSPSATIARIVAENPNRSLWALAFIYGFSSLLNLYQSASLGAVVGPTFLLVMAAIFAPLWGYVTFSVWSWVVTWTGKWFKGQGNFKTTRAAYAWSCVPFTLNIPIWLLMTLLFGRQLFLNFSEGYLLTNGQVLFLLAILIFKVILAIWSLVIYLNALAEVQQYTLLRAILNVVVAGVIVGVVFGLFWTLILYGFGVQVEPTKTAFQLLNEGSSLEVLRRAF
jgi:hypothetical protein